VAGSSAGRDSVPRGGDGCVSVKGVLQAVDQVTLQNTGCFRDGGYGESIRPLIW
jgi:hypothetical protein